MSALLDVASASAPTPATSTTPATGPSPGREAILAGLPAVCAWIAEGAVRRELARELPFDIFQRLRQTGLTWLRIPTALGGPGGSLAEQIEVVCALAAADSNVAHALRSHFAFVETIATDPAGAVARRYAPAVLAGKLFGGAHMEIGTPRPNMLRTTLRRDGPGAYRLDGRKYYATGAAFSDYVSFSALDEDGQLATALVPVDRPGVTILDDWDGMGQRLTASGGVDLANVRVLPDEIAPPRGQLNPFARRHLATRAQLHLMAVVCGITRNVLSDAVAYVQRQARPAKHSAAETARGDAFVQQTVGDIAAASHAVDALVADVARRMDLTGCALACGGGGLDGLVMDAALANSKAQIVIGRLGLRAAEQLFDTGGGSATARKYDFDRHWRNVRTLLNHNPVMLRGKVVGNYLLNGERKDFDEGRVF